MDDNPYVLVALRKLLVHAGHSVIDVPNSGVGIAMHKKEPFDLIITDIVMPGKEGISTIIELKKDYPDLKIIAMSGGGGNEPYGYLDIARRVGADRTVAKPFSGEELTEIVNELLAE
jgi:CheY-like chemotaxis protein